MQTSNISDEKPTTRQRLICTKIPLSEALVLDFSENSRIIPAVLLLLKYVKDKQFAVSVKVDNKYCF